MCHSRAMFLMTACLVAGCNSRSDVAQDPAKKAYTSQNASDRYRLKRERMKKPVTLGEIPRITAAQATPANAGQAQRIKRAIRELSGIERVDSSAWTSVTGQIFLPVDSRDTQAVLSITNPGLESLPA